MTLPKTTAMHPFSYLNNEKAVFSILAVVMTDKWSEIHEAIGLFI